MDKLIQKTFTQHKKSLKIWLIYTKTNKIQVLYPLACLKMDIIDMIQQKLTLKRSNYFAFVHESNIPFKLLEMRRKYL